MRHFRKKTLCLLLSATMLSGCIPRPQTAAVSANYPPIPYQEQTLSQLAQCFSAQNHLVRSNAFPHICAVWLPYMLYDTLFPVNDEAVCRALISHYLSQIQSLGINTIFAHAVAFGEAYYPSALLPPAASACSFDRFALLSEECRRLGISLHAWMNPLRLATTTDMDSLHGDSLLERWYTDDNTRAQYFLTWEQRSYLNPSQENVRSLICRTAAELLNRYPIDGIHIDDYFYPTTDAAFDADSFASSHAAHLADWRREQITALVQAIHGTVHNIAEDAVFSISPRGSIQENHDEVYADVEAWCAEGGVCDWVIPQLYYGFENAVMPFSKVLEEWTTLPRAVSVCMMIGIATYKVGVTDVFAGSGSREWIGNEGIPAKEAAEVLSNDALSGVAFYHFGTTLALSAEEQEAIQQVLCNKEDAKTNE